MLLSAAPTRVLADLPIDLPRTMRNDEAAVEAFRAEGLKVGFYHSVIDWHHEDYTRDPVHPQVDDEAFWERPRDIATYREYLHGQVRELLTNYGKIDIMWFDFTPATKTKEDWDSEALEKLVRELQPEIILNDRIAYPESADFVTPEQYQPRTRPTRDGERVVWVGGASSRRLLVLALVLAVSALPLWFAMWPAALATLVAAAAMGWAYAVTARVDDEEVTVSWGPALWPRIRVPLGEIAGATAEEIEPLRWGGWGYRRTPKGRAAVVRRGPGLVLTLRTVSEPRR